MRVWLFCFLLLGWAAPWASAVALPPALIELRAHEGDGVSLAERGVAWIDSGGLQHVEDVERNADNLPWQPRAADQQDALDGKALWVRFRAVAAAGDPWFLQLGTVGVDRAELWYRAPGGEWVHQLAGAVVPVRDWPVPGRVPTFRLSRAGQPVDYWLRIARSRIDFNAPLLLLHANALAVEREREQFLLGASFGIAMLLVAASLINATAYRDRAFLAFAIYVATLGSGQLARLGVGAQHLWPQVVPWNDASTFVMPALAVPAALWFVKVVTEPARFSPALKLGVRALILAVLGALAVDAVVSTRETIQLVLALVLVSVATLVGLIALAWVRGHDRDIGWFALGFLPVMVLAAFPIGRALNLLPVSVFTRYGISIGAALGMPILYYALGVRSNRRRESAIRAAALPHTDALTGLAQRSAMLVRLKATLERASQQKQTCALLALRIANLDASREEFGLDAVDKAMVVTASHLQKAAGDMNLAARVGENEFALLVENPASGPAALSKAQQIIASGLRQSESLPPGLVLKYHVAVALLPNAGMVEPGAALDWVVEGLAQIDPLSRKAIRPLNF